MAGLEDELGMLRGRCIGCGRCRDVCPSMRHGGCDPMELMRGNEEALSLCIGCGNCSKVCRRTDPAHAIQDMVAVARNLAPSKAYADTGFAMPADPAFADIPSPEWTGEDVFLMPGCVVRCKAPFIENAAADALSAMGFGVSEIPANGCCLHPTMFRITGEPGRYSERRRMFDSARGKPIVTLCGGCSDEFAFSGFKTPHIIRFLRENIGLLPETDVPLKVALEPGCAAMALLGEMEEVVKAMGFVPIGNKPECCGKSIALAPEMMRENEERCEDTDVIVVGCPMCFMKYDQYPNGKPVMHIAELVAFAAGSRDGLRYHRIRPDIHERSRIRFWVG